MVQPRLRLLRPGPFAPPNGQEHRDRFVERARTKLENGNYEVLEIGWFGGEPLLGMKTIRDLAPRLRALANEFDCHYESKVVTNGVALVPSIASELVEQLGVGHIEVTIDGTQEFHDRRRGTKTGRGTFGRIFDNVVALASREDISARLRYAATSIPGIRTAFPR